MEFFALFLQSVNDNYSGLLLVILGMVTLYLGYKEYVIKRRPYIFPELVFENKNENWYFSFILKNNGNYPAQSKINKAILMIGDEPYPTQFNSEMLIPTGEVKKVLSVGHINKIGREKIRTNQYRVNRVEINFEITSKAIGDKNYRYVTEVTYEVDVKGEMPTVKLISEKFS